VRLELHDRTAPHALYGLIVHALSIERRAINVD
jgi:hypothetical protein